MAAYGDPVGDLRDGLRVGGVFAALVVVVALGLVGLLWLAHTVGT